MPRVGVLLGHFLLDSYAGPSTLSSTGQEAAALMQAKWVEPGVIHELQSRSGAVALVPNPVKKPLNVVQQAIGLSTSPRAWAKRGESEVFKWYREKKAEQRYQAALTQWQDERYDRARQLSMAEC